MMRKLLLCLLSILFLFISQNPLHAHDHLLEEKIKVTQKQQSKTDGKIVCVDLADFYYEILLSVTSFPQQGVCSAQEDAEIAILLQKTINTELQAIPGTIKTKNKVCADPINARRHLSTLSPDKPFLFPHEEQHHKNEGILFKTTSNISSQYSAAVDQDKRILSARMRQRSYIYVGGGRCRFCFYDNFDSRALVPVTMKETTTRTTSYFESTNKDRHRRNLLHFSWGKPKIPLPKVADIFLCKNYLTRVFYFYQHPGTQIKHLYWNAIKWTNKRIKTLRVSALVNARRRIVPWDLIGPYVPGERFGTQVDMNNAIHLHSKQYIAKDTIELPVKEGIITFHFSSFDLPKDFSTDIFSDDSLIVFINGIKLDFKLLMSQPGTTKRNSSTSVKIRGDSFAGIRWVITHWKNSGLADSFAYGTQPDRDYKISIIAPLIVFDHKNQFDLDFIIKPNAKAKKYAIRDLRIVFQAGKCEVTGMQNSPFEDFQSVVESRLFHKLGIDLAHEFQGKRGHCLYDKIPVVNLHLVEKKTWKESNPQCRR